MGTAIGALAIGAGLDACEGRNHGGQVGGFALVQRKFQLAFSGQLGTRIFWLPKMVRCCLGPADDAPRCSANWAKSADCCASSCWRKGAARWGSMRGFLGNGLTPPWCARGTHHALTRVKKRLHSPCGEPGVARRKPMHLQLLAAAAAGFPPFFPARAQRLGWRASISAVLVLRSAFTRCTWGRSAMRAR